MRKLSLLLSTLCLAPICRANLIGTTVTGSLTFAANPANFYDPATGAVPATGYQNSPSNLNSPTVIIVGGNEFGHRGSFDQDVTSFSDTGFIFTDTVLGSGTFINNSIGLTFTDTAFRGVSGISSNFSGLTFGIAGDVITVNIPSATVTAGQVFTASFAVTSTPEPSSVALLAIGAACLAGFRRLLKRAIPIVAVLVFLLSGAGLVQAGQITYSDQVTASGTLGSNAFTNAIVTLMMVGDTANVKCAQLGSCVNNVGPVMVNVADIGTATFTDVTVAFCDLPNPKPRCGFVGTSSGVLHSILDTYNGVFASYDFVSPIGPVSGSSLTNSAFTYTTTLGGFNISSAAGTSTFTATTAPEPESLTLFAVGAMALGAWRFAKARRRSSSFPVC
jgi:hypothetical protein